MDKPKLIRQMEQELVDLIEKDDSRSLPAPEVAKLFGMDRDCLRKSILQGRCPFGVGGQSKGKMFARVNKLALWNYMTKGLNEDDPRETDTL